MDSNRKSRITTAVSRLREKLSESRQAVRERDTLREQLASVTAKWQALKAATHWAELDSGTNIAIGTTVRHFGKKYACIKAHTKSLLRSPLNGEYWEEVAEDA